MMENRKGVNEECQPLMYKHITRLIIKRIPSVNGVKPTLTPQKVFRSESRDFDPFRTGLDALTSETRRRESSSLRETHVRDTRTSGK